MSKKINQLLSIIISFVIIGISYLFILNINNFSGYTGDDFLYHFIYRGAWPTAELSEYHHLFDYISAVITHMTIWNGRMTSIIFEILAMQVPKAVFNIINSLIYVIVGVLLNVLISGRRVLFRPLQLGATFLMMWFFLPGLGTTVLWVSGAANYLWATVIVLLFFMPYRFNVKVMRFTKLAGIGLVILGVLTGFTNEVAGSTAILVTLLLTIYNFKTARESDAGIFTQIGGVIAVFIAFLMQLNLSSGSSETSNYGEKVSLLVHIQNLITGTMQNSGWLLLIILALLIVLCFSRKSLDSTSQDLTIKGLIFLFSGFAGIGALIISPITPNRMWFASNILFIIALLFFVEAWQELRLWSKWTYLPIILFIAWMIFAGVASYTFNLKDVQNSYKRFYTDEIISKEAKAAGKHESRVPGMETTTNPYNPYDGTPYITASDHPENQWSNTWFAQYYGLTKTYLDNSVPLRKVPQKNNPFVEEIMNLYQQFFGQLQKKIIPNEEVGQSKKIRNESLPIDERTYHNDIKPNNDNLSPKQPWLRNALIRYINIDSNKVVGVEKITSPYNEKYNISNASTAGYKTLAGNPKSYVFNQDYDQTIDIRVAPQPKTIILYFKTEGKTDISNITIKGVTGESKEVLAPKGYTIDGKDRMTIHISTNSKWYKNVTVKRIPFWNDLGRFKLFYVALVAMTIFFVFDLLIIPSVAKGKDQHLRM
ncbi:hypothetical protein JC2156_07040 [Weissella koreensis KCTC 3621]|uniref:DUF3329 domain-containing protein n=1 Tax=Weissella koreensis TaxID=165096 RepID=UPI00026F1BAD|nr:DUF6056 family protein [Weissella koreensis]EJF33342.1 hypothetical protein JC2156_07040 [Weissella koreensis KCTC 3621]